MGADCKSVGLRLRRFESCTCHPGQRLFCATTTGFGRTLQYAAGTQLIRRLCRRRSPPRPALTVTAAAFLISLNSASGRLPKAQRRCGPIVLLNGVRGDTRGGADNTTLRPRRGRNRSITGSRGRAGCWPGRAVSAAAQRKPARPEAVGWPSTGHCAPVTAPRRARRRGATGPRSPPGPPPEKCRAARRGLTSNAPSISIPGRHAPLCATPIRCTPSTTLRSC